MRIGLGLKLGFAFGLVVSIVLGVGWLGLSRMGRVNADLERIISKRWAKVQLAREALKYSNLNSRITMEILLLRSRAEIDPLLIQRAANTEKISAVVAKIEGQLESETERELFAAVKETRTPYIDSYLHALHLLVDENKPDEARAAMVQVTLPRLIKYHEAWNAFLDFQGDQMDQAAHQSQIDYAAARRLVLSLILLAFAVATAVAIFVTRGMISGMVELNRELEQKVFRRTAELARANQELKNQILERSKVGNTLRASEERFRALAETAPEAIISADAQGRIIYFNPGAERSFGYSATEATGQPIKMLVPERLQESQQKETARCLCRGEANVVGKTFDLVGQRKDGTAFPLTLSLSSWESSGAVFFTAILRDITERKLAMEQLQKAKQAAEAASRAKSEFLANMSHEIRTPMNGIIGMTELALDSELTSEQRENLEMVKLSADSLLSLLNDILDLSKIEAGHLDFDVIDFRLRDGLGDTMKMLSLRAHQKDLELVYRIQPEVPDVLVGDPTRLRQVVVNLVGNAIKFTSRGEVVLQIDLESQTEQEVLLHFSVADTGVGIPVEKQRVIFEAFAQADGSMTRKYGGTGLGLAISTRLVEMMGGRIWVESEPGQGSRFHFTTRLGVSKEQAIKRTPAEPVKLVDLPVLVVDDNATNRRILHSLLVGWKMKPTEVDGGRAGLEALERAQRTGEPFALILLDAQMPEMDGFTFAQRVKQKPELAGSIIMMLTSAGQHGDAARCRELGIAAYLNKPVKQSELLHAIVETLGKRPPSEARPALVTRHSLRESRVRLRILLAEDNAVNQMLVLRLLEKQGHTVTVAANGRAALAALEQQPFDLVLMDVQMPEMDGLEATAAIREKERLTGAHIPIVAMTAHAMKGDQEWCLAAGMDGYVCKPINIQELLGVIEGVVPRSARAENASREAQTDPATSRVRT